MVEDSQFSWLAGLGFFIPACFGPLLFLYCRSAISGDLLKTSDLVHCLPLLFCYLWNADTLLFDSERFRAWIVGGRAPTLRVWLSEYLIFAIELLYMFLTICLIKRFENKANSTLSSFNPAIFKWLWSLILTISVVWLAKAIMAFGSIAIPFMVVFSDALIVAFIYLIALAHWRNPELFYVRELADNKREPMISTKPESKGSLGDETRSVLFESVKQCVEEQQLYLNSELTLASLAETSGLAMHHLSEVLNQHSGQNFNQFINAYRVEYVCERLKENSSESFLELSSEAGFSSKSTFNTMFKKLKGLTPTQYRKQLEIV